MILFLTFLIGFSILDIITLVGKKQKKEMIVYIVMSLITVAFGILYFTSEYETSLIRSLLDLFKVKV